MQTKTHKNHVILTFDRWPGNFFYGTTRDCRGTWCKSCLLFGTFMQSFIQL